MVSRQTGEWKVAEYELAELIATYSSMRVYFFATYLTLLSGYLITAFVAGLRLNFLQVAILNVGFFVAVLILTWATYHAGTVQLHYTNLLLEIEPNSPQSSRDWVMATLGALMGGGILAALIFMWNVRHPKTE
jgi:hypothetical protein